MSDLDESGVTYTEASPSPDYIPGPKEPEQAPPLPDYVPGPEHADDEISDLEAYLKEDDNEDPKENPVDYPVNGGDDDDDKEGSLEDDKDDDMDIEANEEEEEEHPAPADSVVVALPAADQASSAEETEPFETDVSAATPPSHLVYCMTSRISIPAPVLVPAWSDSEVARLLAMSTPPSSPLSPLSSPPPRIPFLPLPSILSPPLPVLSPAPPPSPICSLGYRDAMIRLRAKAASTSHSPPLPPPFILSPTRSDAPLSGIPPALPISAPTSSPPLQLPSASHMKDRPEVTLPPRKRLAIALSPGYEVGESSSATAARPARGLRADYGFVAAMDREIRHDPEREVGYGITDSWDEIVETLQGAPVSTDTELGGYIREFETRVRRDTDEIYSAAYTDIDSDAVTTDTSNPTTRTCDHTTGTGDHTIGDRLTADQERTNTTSVTNAQLQAMIDQGVTAALAALDALRSTYGDDSHNSGMGKTLMKMMTGKYCPRNEIKKLEMEIWDLKVKGTVLTSYTQRSQELALLCEMMFLEEFDKIERYIKGLPDMIHGSVVASKPNTLQEAVEIVTELMDKKICTFAKRETASKKKSENTSRSTQNQQQQPNKWQNTSRVYTAASGEKK
nr:hypothetical protein [Tanacetum cinerariifolium]